MDLEDEVFGVGGELSDLDDSGDEAPQQPATYDPEVDGGSEDEQEPSDDDDDDARDEFRPDTAQLARAALAAGASMSEAVPPGQLPKFKKKKRGADDRDQPAAERPAKKKKTSKRKQPAEDEDDANLDPAARKRKALQDRLDYIVNPNKDKKKKSKRKKGEEEEEDLGAQLDEERINRLRQEMVVAAHTDSAARDNDEVATAKLLLLPRIIETMRKTALHNIALDSGILSEFKMWLEPALDKSLPSLTIQRALFDLILRFPEISTDQLRESDLGKIVLFYTKCPRVDPAIKRQALGLVSAWLRPMLKKKAVWREKHVPRVGRGGVADDEDDGTAPRLSRREREQQDRIRQQALQAAIERGEGGTGAGVTNRLKDERMARIPNASVPMFKIAPKNRTDRTAETSEGTHFGSSTTRFRDYNKQIKATAKKTAVKKKS